MASTTEQRKMTDKKNPTIFEIFGPMYDLTRTKGRFGIEVETESSVSYEIPTISGWAGVRDGSLRINGMEFILRRPVDIGGVRPCVERLFDSLSAAGANLIETPSSSVHVHVNVQDMDIIQLGNLFTIATLVENLLLKFSGELRRSNAFCLGQSDAEANNSYICNFFSSLERSGPRRVRPIGDNTAKYAAVNIASLFRRGSVEFRSFRGSTNADEIVEWVDVINSLVEFAFQDITPQDIVSKFEQYGADYVSEVFSRELWTKLYSSKDDEELLMNNDWLAASIASSVYDWRGLANAAGKKSLKGQGTNQTQTFDWGRNLTLGRVHFPQGRDPALEEANNSRTPVDRTEDNYVDEIDAYEGRDSQEISQTNEVNDAIVTHHRIGDGEIMVGSWRLTTEEWEAINSTALVAVRNGRISLFSLDEEFYASFVEHIVRNSSRGNLETFVGDTEDGRGIVLGDFLTRRASDRRTIRLGRFTISGERHRSLMAAALRARRRGYHIDIIGINSYLAGFYSYYSDNHLDTLPFELMSERTQDMVFDAYQDFLRSRATVNTTE